jgi:glycosyltransferase involved in cell wall biosynthesis
VVLTLHDYYFPCPLVHLTKKSGARCHGPDEGAECARTCFQQERAGAGRWLLRYRYFGQVLALPERVICPNVDLAERVRTMAPLARVEVAPLGIKSDDGPLAPRSKESEALRLGFFGTVAPHKGVSVLLDALARTNRPAELLVAGPTPKNRYRRLLERRAAAARLRVEWRGPYEPADLAGLLAEVDVVVAPSAVPEVYPLAIREALAHGVPVLAARQPGLVDVIVDEVNGLLFTPGEVGELACCVDRLAGSRPLLDTLRAGSDRTAVVSQTEHVRYLLSLYAQVVGGPRTIEEARGVLDGLHHEALQAGFANRGLPGQGAFRRP